MVEDTRVSVDGRSGAFKVAPCTDKGGRHAVARLVDGEVEQGALGLRAPVPVYWDLYLTESVGLGASLLES